MLSSSNLRIQTQLFLPMHQIEWYAPETKSSNPMSLGMELQRHKGPYTSNYGHY